MRKYVVLTLIVVLLLSSLLTALPPSTALTKPSTPKFTIEKITDSYDVPTTYTTDPYTGKTIVDRQGYRIENTYYALKIKNQPLSFTPYISKDNVEVNLYYQYRYKGHYADGEYWQPSSTGTSTTEKYRQSDSEYTFIALDLWHPREGDQFDIQVRVFIGGRAEVICMILTGCIAPGIPDTVVEGGPISDWSSTQTLTYDNVGSTSIPQSPDKPTPTINTGIDNSDTSTSNPPALGNFSLLGLDWTNIIIIALLGSVVILLTIIIISRHKKSAVTQA
jgi:hypothetical protein